MWFLVLQSLIALRAVDYLPPNLKVVGYINVKSFMPFVNRFKNYRIIRRDIALIKKLYGVRISDIKEMAFAYKSIVALPEHPVNRIMVSFIPELVVINPKLRIPIPDFTVLKGNLSSASFSLAKKLGLKVFVSSNQKIAIIAKAKYSHLVREFKAYRAYKVAYPLHFIAYPVKRNLAYPYSCVLKLEGYYSLSTYTAYGIRYVKSRKCGKKMRKVTRETIDSLMLVASFNPKFAKSVSLLVSDMDVFLRKKGRKYAVIVEVPLSPAILEKVLKSFNK